jgi:hypothetical protein
MGLPGTVGNSLTLGGRTGDRAVRTRHFLIGNTLCRTSCPRCSGGKMKRHGQEDKKIKKWLTS